MQGIIIRYVTVQILGQVQLGIKYLDEYGYWRFVTKGEYDSISGREKYSGGYADRNYVYSYMNSSNERVFVEKWFL